MPNKIVYYVLNNEICRKSGRVGQMSQGKMVAQVSHAALKTFQTAPTASEWQINDFQAHIFNGNHEIINKVIAKANEANVHYCTVRDAGRTQIEFGSLTVLSLGPSEKDTLDRLVLGLSQLE